MKLSGVKAMVSKVMAVGLVAGAFALVAPVKAEAQQYGIGVQIGPSGYEQGRWNGYEGERYERQREAIERHEAWERQRAWEQHERWEHAREYYRGRGYDRDDDRRDYDRGQYGYAVPRGYYGR